MIDQFLIDGNMILIAHRSQQISLPDEQNFTFKANQLSQYNLHHYVLTENTLFLDDDKAVSLAAQISNWPGENTASGDYNVFIPGDKTIYHALISIRPKYISIQSERFVTFEEAAGIVLKNPTNSMVNDSGALSKAFKQQNLKLTDLGFDFRESRSNPYYMRYGLNRTQLVITPLATLIVIIFLFFIPNIIKTLFNLGKPAEVSTEVIPPPTEVHNRLSHDLFSIGDIMNNSAILVLYGLDQIIITPTDSYFEIHYNGQLNTDNTIGRLRQISGKRHGRLELTGNLSWNLHSEWPRKTDYDKSPPTDLYNQLDQWRLLSLRHNLPLNYTSESPLHDATNFHLTITVRNPLPHHITLLAKDIKNENLFSTLENVRLSSGFASKNTWSNIELNFIITGIKQ